MNKWLKECLWAAALVLIPIVLVYMNSTADGATIDINIHDTYFVMDSIALCAIISVCLWFPVYLIRVLVARFGSLPMNIGFMTACFCTALLLTSLISYIEAVAAPGWTIYPPLSALPQEIPDSDSEPLINTCYLLLLQAILILLIAYTAYRIGKNQKRT